MSDDVISRSGLGVSKTFNETLTSTSDLALN